MRDHPDGEGEESDPFLELWNRFLPPTGQLDRSALAPLQQPPPQPPPAPLGASKSPATRDATWLGTNQASTRLTRQNVVAKTAPTLLADLKDRNNKDATEHQARKDKYKKKPAASAAAAAAAPTGAVPALPRTMAPKAVAVQEVAPPAVAPAQIETLEQHRVRNDQTQLFAINIERPHRTAPVEAIINTPPPVGTLRYCATLPTSDVPWYAVATEAIARRPNMGFPRTPLMRRSVLLTFLRAPDPHQPYERPCFNLDRNPYNHERGLRMRCVAHRMSAEQLGEAKAFRCRELLYNGQMVKIHAALATQGAEDPRNHLHDIPELCYMCHIWLTTEAALDQRNKMAVPTADDMLVIFNHFMVMIDQPGEYSRHATLCSADVSIGIWGPFPRWNERNYRAGRLSCGLLGFEESEEMLFREARKPSSLSEQPAPALGRSTRSDPTACAQTGRSTFPA